MFYNLTVDSTVKWQPAASVRVLVVDDYADSAESMAQCLLLDGCDADRRRPMSIRGSETSSANALRDRGAV